MLQYLQHSNHNDKKKINYKNCLHIGPCTQCVKMSHKMTHMTDQTQNHF